MDINPEEIKYLGELQKLDLKPTDILVISYDFDLDDAICERIADAVRKNLKVPDQRVFVVPKGVKVGVISMPEEDQWGKR